MHVIALFIAMTLNATANLLMKVGMNRVHAGGGILKEGIVGAIKTVLLSPALVIGLTCFGLNAAFYMYALQSPALKISLAYPVMVGGGFAIIALTAFLTMNERLTPLQWLGVAMVLAGVCIIAMRTPTDQPLPA